MRTVPGEIDVAREGGENGPALPVCGGGSRWDDPAGSRWSSRVDEGALGTPESKTGSALVGSRVDCASRMSTFSTFSKRLRGRPTSFVYDVVPEPLRMQIRIILHDALGSWSDGWQLLDRIMEREHPISSFRRDRGSRYQGPEPYVTQCVVFGTFAESMDGLETALRLLNKGVRDQPAHHAHVFFVKQSVDDAIGEVNERFLEQGVGYQFSIEENQIIRLDSEVLHAEAVEPAIRLLRTPGFEGPSDEFSKAHAYHRAGEGKDAISWAVKALESTAKTICDARGWRYEKTDAAKRLLDALFKNGLVPSELESHFSALQSALVSGLPTIGNRMTRHGQGSQVKPIADHIVTFGMHLAAAAIVFLVGAHQAKP